MQELPEDVRQLLHVDRRQAAITLLRDAYGLSADEAERRVDQYLEDNPPLRPRGAAIVRASRANALIWLTLIILMALLGLLFAH
ncbi:hypothetical protein OU800_17905 [Pseudomonas sp. GOM7]|uniref:hypothetical protein n=1 Tax=Pseudomonas sp. GOM7 TaxID=2998079 RepID=UPI00227BC7C4|nr:hypothetical protein [Pseudomonas sp. GOM7]WAJ36474.1 hypothetical protein OU800_17905 [Pseudomonas sp. GOM7]